MQLNPEQIVVGGQYLMTEWPEYSAVVTILENQSGLNRAMGHDASWVGWRVRIDRIHTGKDAPPIGAKFSVGWDETSPRYACVSFAPAPKEEKPE